MKNDTIVRQEFIEIEPGKPKFPIKVGFVNAPDEKGFAALSREMEAMLDTRIVAAVAPVKA